MTPTGSSRNDRPSSAHSPEPGNLRPRDENSDADMGFWANEEGKIVRFDRAHPLPNGGEQPNAGEQPNSLESSESVDSVQIPAEPRPASQLASATDTANSEYLDYGSHQRDSATESAPWINVHAIDLVDRLQGWAADLDARESQLNLRASLQEQRERQFRLSQQTAEAEMAEQQRSIQRIRQELETQARRLAFQG